jgi:hypothetical protein
MRTVYFLIVLSFGITFTNAQTITYYSKPDSTQGNTAELWSLYPTTPLPNSPDYIAADWTWNADTATLNSLMQFDLSSIPQGATIIDASLSLYYNPTSSSNGQQGNNASYLRRITSSWNKNTVTWNTVPTFDTTNQVLLPMSDSINQNYLNLDVQNIVQDMVNNPTSSFGFMFMQQVSTLYSAMKFASFAHADTSLHPSLLIHYRSGCITLNTFAQITNAKIWSNQPTTNMYADPDIISAYWTWNSYPGYLKSLLQIDLSSIPNNATINSATLDLFYNTFSSSNGQQGTNASYLQLIVSSWLPQTVTWNTQPSISNYQQVLLPMSDSLNENYTGIDVTNLISNLYHFPNIYTGIELELQDSIDIYSAMKFCNETVSDTTKKPILVICYSIIPTEIPSVSANNNDIIIYPNPSSGVYSILYSNKTNEKPTLEVINVLGQIVYSSKLSGKGSNLTETLDLSNQSNGMYLIRINNGKEVIAKKVIKE